MTWKGVSLSVWLGLLVVWFAPTVTVAAVTTVEPSELTKHPELIGREIVVDDRVALFLFHPGRDFDEITLKRTTVLFRLPPRLRYKQSPGAPAVRLTGTLNREGDQWVCDVSAVELFPKDLARLNRGVSVLPPGEFEKRTAWAAWAERRGREFQDDELLKRAREIELDAIRFEAESRSTNPAALWIKLAKRARDHNLPESEASALAHRSFRDRFGKATTVQDLSSLSQDVSEFFPGATLPVAANVAEISKWDEPYDKDPAQAYRSAPEPARKALDHRLWADVTQRFLERSAEADPQQALKLGEQAVQQLPDRPKVAEQLFELGLKTATVRLGKLRLNEAKALAQIYSDQLHQPDRARDLLRNWLDAQRHHHMSPTDAESRISLANHYENLVDDKATAVELLQSAWKIDPQSKDLADAFRRRGFRKVNDEWVESNRSKAREATDSTEAPAVELAPMNRKLINLTPAQVRSLLGGKPNRVVYSGTQGQLVEQWIYFGTKQDQFINFLRTPGSESPRVVAYYSLPRRSD